MPDLESVFEVTFAPDLEHIPRSERSHHLVVVCAPARSATKLGDIAELTDTEAGVVVMGLRSWRPWALDVAISKARLRRSGLEIVRVYRALSDPWAPEYLFLPTQASSAFALDRFMSSRRLRWPWIRKALQVWPLRHLAVSLRSGALVLCRVSVATDD